jgi:hypothetical protein
MGLIVDAILLGLAILILWLLYLIPVVRRNVRWLWYRHYPIIIAIATGLFVAFVVMPQILKKL